MDEHRQGVATNGARAESRSEQGWGKDRSLTAYMRDLVLPAMELLGRFCACVRVGEEEMRQ